MKVWFIAHAITIMSGLMAVLGAIFISPYVITSLVATAFIFNSAERIRRRENRGGHGI